MIILPSANAFELDQSKILLSGKEWDRSILKEFADEIVIVAKNIQFFLWDRQKTLWEKEKMLVNRIYSFCLWTIVK